MSQSDEITKRLFNQAQEDYEGSKYKDHLLEQYKLYVEMADRISTRRQTANSFFLSINTAIVALASYVGAGTGTQGQLPDCCWLIALAGIVLSYIWYRLIRSYRDLNTAKFKVIHEIESRLPLSPYDAEWEAAGRGEHPKLYLPFTRIEVRVPWVFLLIHLFVLVRSIVWQEIP